jgi:NTE family protein
VATDLQTGADRTFTSGEILPSLLASIAMPGIFPPVEIEGRMYTDGGVANNVPIAPAVAMGARTIYVLDATAQNNAQHRPLNRPIDYLVHAFGLARSKRFEIEAPLYSSKVELILIPAAAMDFYVPFASMDFTARLIDLSYEHTRRFLSGELESETERVDESVEVIAPAK